MVGKISSYIRPLRRPLPGGCLRPVPRPQPKPSLPSSPIRHPFSDSIMSAPLSARLKIPLIKKYDGLSDDAEEHLAVFNTHMLFYGNIATDPIMCRAFPTTLTQVALRWFSDLPPKSIHDFAGLSAKFLDRHAAKSVPLNIDEGEKEEKEEEEKPPEVVMADQMLDIIGLASNVRIRLLALKSYP